MFYQKAVDIVLKNMGSVLSGRQSESPCSQNGAQMEDYRDLIRQAYTRLSQLEGELEMQTSNASALRNELREARCQNSRLGQNIAAQREMVMEISERQTEELSRKIENLLRIQVFDRFAAILEELLRNQESIATANGYLLELSKMRDEHRETQGMLNDVARIVGEFQGSVAESAGFKDELARLTGTVDTLKQDLEQNELKETIKKLINTVENSGGDKSDELKDQILKLNGWFETTVKKFDDSGKTLQTILTQMKSKGATLADMRRMMDVGTKSVEDLGTEVKSRNQWMEDTAKEFKEHMKFLNEFRPVFERFAQLNGMNLRAMNQDNINRDVSYPDNEDGSSSASSDISSGEILDAVHAASAVINPVPNGGLVSSSFDSSPTESDAASNGKRSLENRNKPLKKRRVVQTEQENGISFGPPSPPPDRNVSTRFRDNASISSKSSVASTRITRSSRRQTNLRRCRPRPRTAQNRRSTSTITTTSTATKRRSIRLNGKIIDYTPQLL